MCANMTFESKDDGQMGNAMTNCKLVQCIRLQKSDGRITTKITAGTHTRNQRTDVTFTSLQSTLHRSSMMLQMRRVYDDEVQQWRASMILWSCRDVRKQCALQKLRRQGSVAITAVRVLPTCGERKAKHRLALQRKRRRIVTVQWRGFGALVRCQSGPPSCSPYPDQTPLPRHRARSQCAGQATATENLITFGPKFCPNP